MKTRYKVLIGIVCLIILFGVSAFIGFLIFKDNGDTLNYAVTDDCVYEENMYEAGMLDNVEASSTEEKVSPNAIFIIKKKFKGCGHITEQEAQLPTEIINKTQEEVEEMYGDFEIEGFSSNEIILYKEVEGKCNEHYKIKEEDGVIAIYNINEKGEETLYDKTGISTEYLTESDLENIRKGLEVYGKQKLNSFIEDFE